MGMEFERRLLARERELVEERMVLVKTSSGFVVASGMLNFAAQWSVF